ncbi:NADPH-dependent 7-cyano-7-deazaguanine reductase QueF [Xylophilus rhododendri]|uniref:NADPH-dependent 7-cyano-7-deazaguanine reductase n=1 Tax=Xylophilus rhododendri TaxID=2697032 RepID=A0A857J5E1_9BURK|nr:NADPH-dependent 7-cyano-7-deazaguanine reductase QueF [Xylophilus rhododendri]QHI98058.1 NADPH-dependent 7-cyano-7-deazaguanine reductase QueF [Xylophilus rhododendri]
MSTPQAPAANTPEQSLLGKPAPYAAQYDPGLLFPLPRADKRAEIGIEGAPPFFGADLWTAFEISWLNSRGKPQIALAHFTVPCETPNIVESKSFKLYLNSFNDSRFDSADEVRARIRADVSEAVWRGAAQPSTIGVRLVLPEEFGRERIEDLEGLSLDRLDLDCERYTPAPEFLTAAFDETPVNETLVSHLLKSNCLVTGQPDWGSVQIRYSGPQIDQAGLLRYLISFRNHHEFHEQCVERIFMDIWQRCRPGKLAVFARYTRRGGLDINPLRTSHPQALPGTARTARQ